MKNLLNRKDKKQPKKLPTRITNDTVAQHREKVLAAGRKHKYPIQYTKRRLVWITMFVSVAILAIFVGLGWAQLYLWKDTSDIAYRITKILPLPVANIDGENANYSDYLLYHRSSLAVLQTQGQSDQKDKVKFYQNQSINKALEVAYAKRLARENNITVDDNKVQDLIKKQQESSKLSQSAYESVVKDNLHWSMDELKIAMKYTLLKQEVSFKIDKTADDLVSTIQNKVKSGKSLKDIADEMGNKVQPVFNLSVSTDNSDGGLTKSATLLAKGKISEPLKTLAGDGYYFVTLNSFEDNTVNYSYVKVPLTEFNNRFNYLKNNNKVKYFISIDK
ncbi:hypothetical protein TM7x_00500 [Candidatus Nanosynbacter lyticus]|jgi:hypothetical protein cdiviTM7_03053|uniref:PpiC domain-containing protein n=1 Tax=Candidatus Nanosynbacter lyticus TaxID=2093824 RepID=A0A6S4GTZ0_9BACT|nr:SurA N-terminal domain-containing protein [Candidatus Nanosynbacter lyticus]AJA06714.1 hypothetical protein TM7x_00500 [Candidatus Nanosynbacter lyticus]QCT41266.1 hypothetical protein FBF38_00480 [TM7 phylum sp. oral taxon 952]